MQKRSERLPGPKAVNFNTAGLAIIKAFEGCKLEAYRDLRNILTIGYGCTRDVVDGLVISQEDAEARLAGDLASRASQVQKLVKVPLTDNQFSACVCLAFNIGIGNFQDSTLLRKLNQFQYTAASEEFLNWDHINKIEVPGLLRRREAERDLFLQS